MKTKDEKVAKWKRRKNAPVICEDNSPHSASIAVRGILTIHDGKADSEWDNDSTKWKYE